MRGRHNPSLVYDSTATKVIKLLFAIILLKCNYPRIFSDFSFESPNYSSPNFHCIQTTITEVYRIIFNKLVNFSCDFNLILKLT